MRTAHREDAGNEPRDVAGMPDDVDTLPLVKLIPEGMLATVARRVHAEIAVVGDLADGISHLVDAARERAPRPPRAESPNEIPLGVAREAARRRDDSRRRL